MTVSLKHAFQSAKPDGADTSIVRPSDWNAEHVLTQATNKLLGRTSTGTGATEEITAGSGLTLGSGTLSADVTSVAGRTGAVTLSVADVSGAAPAASPTFTGKSSFPASTSTGANVNLGNGANVTSNLVDGDIWIETNNLRWYSNGVTWRASAVGHTHVSTAITDSTAAGRALLTGADASAQRTSLGLGSAALLNTSVIVQQDSATGSAYLPAGTTAQRPGTPAAGYIRYNSTTGKFEGFGSSWGNIGGGAAIGDTPPANPGAGDLWWESDLGRMFVYYTDANSSQWVDISAGGAGQYLPLTGGTVTGTLNLSGALVTTDGTSTTRILNSGGVGITGTSTNHPFIIQSNNAERVRVTAAGLVGIGTGTPGYVLDVLGTGQFTAVGAGSFGSAHVIATATTGNAAIALHCAGASAPMIRNERGAGNVIDSVDATQTAFANFRAAAFTVASDYRIKENLSPINNATDRLKQLNPLRFSFTEGSMMWNEGRVVDGFLAHEVAPVVPEAVTGEKDAVKEDGTPLYQSLDQAKLVPLLTAALQEAISRIETLEQKLAAIGGE
jgi:hypothetical protein